MKETLLDELMKISSDATAVTVQGVEMQVIDEEEAHSLLGSDPDDNHIHECVMKNGRFLFVKDGGKLISLYKVTKALE